MKKTLTLSLALILVLTLTLTGCGKDKDSNDPEPTSSPSASPAVSPSPSPDVPEPTDPDESATESPDLSESPTATPETSAKPSQTPSPTPTATPSPTPKPTEPAGNLSGSTSSILESILSKAASTLSGDDELPRSFTDPVSASNAKDTLGLTASQFTDNVADAYVSTAAIGSFAHQVALIKCNDAAAAQVVKSAVASGFDSGKWICVFPEQSFVVDSGSYVLLVATTNVRADKLRAAFSSIAGTTGNVNTFYKHQ